MQKGKLTGLLTHPWIVAAGNILLLMAIYTLMRLYCYLVNLTLFPNISFQHLLEILLGGMRFDLTAILYLSSAYLLLALLPLEPSIRTRKSYQTAAHWLLWIPNILGILVNMADIAYIPFSDRRTTCTVFTEFEHESNLSRIILEAILDNTHTIIVALLLLFAFILLTKRDYQLPKLQAGKQRILYYLRETLILLLSVYFIVIGIRGGFGRYTRPITLSNALQYTDTPRESALVLNTPFSLMKSIENEPYVEPNYFDSTLLPQLMTPLHPADSTDMRIDNVVVLILESFSSEYIGFYNTDKTGYTSYTPFLDSLLAHSVTYTNSYAAGRKSIDAMPSILSSIPMLIEPYIVTPYSTNSVSSIADCLNQKGYTTAFFHGAPNGSMGFQAYARSAGFNSYYGMDEYNNDADFDGTWAIWDEPFLQFYAHKMSELKEPFMTAVFTASSHHPFRVPEQYRNTFPLGPHPIHRTIGYSDYALRQFFLTASQQPWYDHTLFVITADHTNRLTMPEYTNARGLYQVPIAFFHPLLKPQKRTQVINQTDIMPSVLSWVGYDKPYFAFGEDALTRPKTHPYAVCYNAPLYQIISDSLLLQFDGKQVVAVYDFHRDPTLQQNIVHTIDSSRIEPMTTYLKAYIQQYIHRMINDQLTAE